MRQSLRFAGLFFLGLILLAVPRAVYSVELPEFSVLAARVDPAVVNISTTKLIKSRSQGAYPGFRDPFFDEFFERFFGAPPGTGTPPGGQTPQTRAQHSLGSGFVISASGDILTNHHVVMGADEIVVKFASGKEYEAKVVGVDDKTDLAVIHVEAKDLPYAKLGDSDALKVGDWVLAIGNPFGLGHTVTAGIVSAKGRVIGAGPYDDFIQTDASINPGNSGGPLFNLNGEVIGVNTAIIASGQGIGFAIPVNIAKTLVPQLIATGRVSRAWLGVAIQELSPELAESYGLSDTKGALVASVEIGGPAARAGIRPGDVILSANGQVVVDAHALPRLISNQKAGSRVSLELWRNGKRETVAVLLQDMSKDDRKTASGERGGRESSKADLMGLYLSGLSAEEKSRLGLSAPGGVAVMAVEPGSPAEALGIVRGDIILSLNNLVVDTAEKFEIELAKVKKGGLIRLFLARNGLQTFIAFRKNF